MLETHHFRSGAILFDISNTKCKYELCYGNLRNYRTMGVLCAVFDCCHNAGKDENYSTLEFQK